MKIFFATHNPGKVREFKKILDGIADVEQINLEYDEIQSDSPEEVAKAKTGVHCPKCSDGEITERRGKFGSFYSCSNYPKCKNIKNIKKEKGANGEEVIKTEAGEKKSR